MSVKIIEERLSGYRCHSQQEEEQALREITQEIVLCALYGAGFFKHAAFHGGTSLRIFYGLERFSEDLDFALLTANLGFNLSPYLKALAQSLSAYGYELQTDDRSREDAAMKSAFLKDDSLGRILRLKHPKTTGTARTIKVKLEVDANPPAGADIELKFHDFPTHFAAGLHNSQSLFAGKCHALLCREYVKGRDWFDFLWYAGRKTPANLTMLGNALNQQGPWKGQGTVPDNAWLFQELKRKIESIDWNAARDDVRRFLRPAAARSLDLWCTEFFVAVLQRYEDETRITKGLPR